MAAFREKSAMRKGFRENSLPKEIRPNTKIKNDRYQKSTMASLARTLSKWDITNAKEGNPAGYLSTHSSPKPVTTLWRPWPWKRYPNISPMEVMSASGGKGTNKK